MLIPKVNYRTVYPEKLSPWPPVCLLASEKVLLRKLLHLRGVLNFFLCFRSELATEVVLHGAIRPDSNTFMIYFERTKFGSNKIAFLSQTDIDFEVGLSSRAVRISSRAVRISSRAVRVSPTL